MGGSYYDRDVGHASSTPKSGGGFDYSTYSARASAAMSRSSAARETDPKVCKTVSTDAANPVVIGVDVTGSMSTWPKVIWDKLPMFYGQIMIQGYLKDPAVSFAAVGDYNDQAPLQVCDFAKGDKLDDEIKKIWLEGGGSGGSGVDGLPAESYGLFGYYYLNRCKLEKPVTPFLFLCSDECFYPEVEAEHVRDVIGDAQRKEPWDTPGIFKALARKFNVFLLRKSYPAFEERINKHWVDVLGPDHVIPLEDPKSVIDVMLGVIALVSGARDLDTYAVDMKGRDQTKERIDAVKKSLGTLGEATAIAKVDATHLPAKTGGKKRGGGGKKL